MELKFKNNINFKIHLLNFINEKNEKITETVKKRKLKLKTNHSLFYTIYRLNIFKHQIDPLEITNS